MPTHTSFLPSFVSVSLFNHAVIRDGPRRARESVLNIQSLGFHFGRVQIDTSDPPTLVYTLYRAEIWSPTTFVPVWNHTVALAS